MQTHKPLWPLLMSSVLGSTASQRREEEPPFSKKW
jgi:hypothetical protein